MENIKFEEKIQGDKMNTNKITDLHIQISKEDLKILDLLLKANEYSNIVFYCENDEEHFIFTEVKFGRDFYINKGENVEKIYEEYSNFKDANIDKKELFEKMSGDVISKKFKYFNYKRLKNAHKL